MKKRKEKKEKEMTEILKKENKTMMIEELTEQNILSLE